MPPVWLELSEIKLIVCLVQISPEHNKLLKQLGKVRQIEMKETSDIMDWINRLIAERESVIQQSKKRRRY